ncbi:hypothetical protein TrVE_jg13805 [Triparma verrucosa]|uniref:EF-hand domain-containing protein n=1 Tax=Triparma verrucosa TaxID=1606542 RepID=A0A9W7CDD8_9STRA|nr:hypothetical protein TrVE_jg13805 [Triparma verrucosa]
MKDGDSSQGSLAPMESLITSLTLPNIGERHKQAPALSAEEASPYLQSVGRKWETAKSRRMKKKKLAKRKARAKQVAKTQSQNMADLQSSIMSPAALDQLSASMSFTDTLKVRPGYNGVSIDDDQSFASSNDDSTINEINSATSSVKQSFLEQMLAFEALEDEDDEDGPTASKTQSTLQPPLQTTQPSTSISLSGETTLPSVQTAPPPSRPPPTTLSTAGSESFLRTSSLMDSFDAGLSLDGSLAQNSMSSDYFDDPLNDAPVNLTILLDKAKSIVGKMIVMKKSPLSKIRTLLATHYTQYVPKQFQFIGDPTSLDNTVRRKAEAFLQVSDISIFRSFDDRGVANMEIRVRPKVKGQLPFSQCTNMEDFIRISKEENDMKKRMSEAELSGAATVLGKLEGFIRKYQLRLSDLFYGVDKSGDGSLDGKELQQALRNIKCTIADDKMDKLVEFLDDSGDGSVDVKELEEALRQFRRTQKQNKTNGIYVSDSIALTRKAVKQLWNSNDNGPPVSPRAKRLGLILDPINTLTKPRDAKSLASALESTMTVPPAMYNDYVEQVSLASSTTAPTKSGRKKNKKHRHRVRAKRLVITDEEIEQCLDHLKLIAEDDRIAFTAFTEAMVKGATETKNVAEQALKRTLDILVLLKDEWKKMEAKMEIKMMNDSPTLTDDDIDKVIQFMDPNADGIDAKELEEAFRLIKRSAAAEAMEPGAVSCMKILIARIRKSGCKLDDLFLELDRSGDGIVSHPEIADWLSSFGVQIDDINATLRYLDPDDDGDMETDELAQAMRRAEVTVGRLEIEEKAKQEVLEKVAHADKAVKKAVAMQPDSFTSDEIKTLVRYLDPSGDGSITITELEGAFRKARRAKAMKGLMQEGKKLLTKLKNLLDKKKMTVEKWFNKMDSSGAAKSDGNCTMRELRLGLKKLSGKSKKGSFSESDILKLVRFMDPSGEGDISVEEAKDAFAKIGTVSEEEIMENEVGNTMIRLEAFMKEKGMRLFDFFANMDKSGDGDVDIPELTAGLMSLSEPSGAVKALIKRRDEALERQAADAKIREEEDFLINERIKKANESGAAGVLKTLETCMKDKGLRMTDLFREIDKSGDGQISAEELRFGMKLMSEPKAEALAPLKRAQEKLAQKRAELISKMMAAQKFEDKVSVAAACGADKVIDKLESFMRRKQMRVKDLFYMIDKSGDGSANAVELHAALKKAKLKMSLEEVETLISFMDTSGDAEIDRDELELVIRDFRRFAYEQKNKHMLGAKKLPLSTMYGKLEDIFISTDVISGMFCRGDINFALRRLRGDISMPSGGVKVSEEDKNVCSTVLSKLGGWLEGRELSELLGEYVGGDNYDEISCADMKTFLASVKVKIKAKSRKKLTKPISNIKPIPQLSDEDVENICNFVDPDNNGIDLKELQKAFAMVLQAGAHSKMAPEALTAMKKMKAVMKEKKLRLSGLFAKLDASGDGVVDHSEIRKWLLEVGLDDDDCAALIKYLDPDEDGDMETDELASAMRKADMTIGRMEIRERENARLKKKEEEADKILKEASETPKLDFSEDEVNCIAKFLDPSGDGTIEISEFEAAFRKARRARAVESFVQTAKNLVRKLKKILDDLQLPIDEWFDLMDTSFGEGVGGSVTECELKNGLACMKFPENTTRFTQGEVVKLVRYLDPSGEGDMTIDEVQKAFDEVNKPSPADDLKGEVGDALSRLEGFMKDKGMRLIDLLATFSGVGTGNGEQGSDGSMTTKDLKVGLKKICAPSPQLQALVKRKTEAAAERKRLDAEREEEEKRINDQLKVLEESGTARIMRSIHEIMREKGKTLGAVFNEIDKTGDGSIDRSELKGGLEMLTAASDMSKFAVQKELEKKAAEMAEIEAREKIRKDFFARMEKAKEDGIAAIIDKIDQTMRKRQLRIKDLLVLKKGLGTKTKFSKGRRKSQGGETKKFGSFGSPPKSPPPAKALEESISPSDLMSLLKKVNKKLDITEEECVRVCDYIDEGGDGTIDLTELEMAINDYRRYLWEKEQVVRLERLREMKAAPQMFTKRECNICVNSLDAVGGMDGNIRLKDLELGIKRATGEMPTLSDDFVDGTAGFVAGARVPSPVKVQEMASTMEGEAKETVETVPETPASFPVEPVNVLVPEMSASTNFMDRYQVLVLEPDEVAPSKKRVVYSEPKEIRGEVLMLRFSKDAGGLEVDALSSKNNEEKKTGFFSPKALRSKGYGDLDTASDTELVEVCKRMAGGLGVEHTTLHLLQLN